MNITKNLKISSIFMTSVLVSTVLCISLLYQLASHSSQAAIHTGMQHNMDTYLQAETSAVQDFVSSSEQSLILFSKSPIVKEYLKDQNNKDLFQKAQSYTTEYYNHLENWEGLYIANWNSKVLTYNVPEVIGKVLREGDRLEELRNGMLNAKNGIYNLGIIVSPGTGKLCLSMYVPVFDTDGKTPIGYVGAGVFNDQLDTILKKNSISGLTKSQFYMINTETKINYINPDKKTLAKETTDPILLKQIELTKKQKKEGTFDYNDKIVIYKQMKNYPWSLILVNDKNEVLSSANATNKKLLFSCIVAEILICILCLLAVIITTKPLKKTATAIQKLGMLDLTPSKELQTYINGKSEVGILATEIDHMRNVFLDIINTLHSCSDAIHTSSESMTNHASELVDAVVTNASTTEQLAASMSTTTNVLTALNEKVKTIDQLISNVESVIEKGNSKSNELLDSAETIENKSQSSYKDSERNIELNRKQIEEAVNKLQELSQINTLVADILELSNQTNLLSLNASIEAARAGEAGRGFAVVASEIGNLANNSSTTAETIKNICLNASGNIKDVSNCFNQIVDYLESNVTPKFAEFSEIARGNNTMSVERQQIISNIKIIVDEFVDFVKMVTTQMSQIGEAATQNEEGIDIIVEQNNQTSLIAEHISTAIEQNNESAEQLRNIIEKFHY